MSEWRPRKDSGFTLIELVTVVVIIGILAGIALPSFQSTIYRADAVKVVADMNAIRLAVFEFREDNNRLPRAARWGQAPSDLVPYLGGMPFGYKDLEYRLRVNNRRGNIEFYVRYPRRSPIGNALRQYRRPGSESGSVSWTLRKTKFRILVNNR
jgi:prepilin-type N-terminal cleavage/methylation domain-containing protein